MHSLFFYRSFDFFSSEFLLAVCLLSLLILVRVPVAVVVLTRHRTRRTGALVDAQEHPCTLFLQLCVDAETTTPPGATVYTTGTHIHTSGDTITGDLYILGDATMLFQVAQLSLYLRNRAR